MLNRLGLAGLVHSNRHPSGPLAHSPNRHPVQSVGGLRTRSGSRVDGFDGTFARTIRLVTGPRSEDFRGGSNLTANSSRVSVRLIE